MPDPPVKMIIASVQLQQSQTQPEPVFLLFRQILKKVCLGQLFKPIPLALPGSRCRPFGAPCQGGSQCVDHYCICRGGSKNLGNARCTGGNRDRGGQNTSGGSSGQLPTPQALKGSRVLCFLHQNLF